VSILALFAMFEDISGAAAESSAPDCGAFWIQRFLLMETHKCHEQISVSTMNIGTGKPGEKPGARPFLRGFAEAFFRKAKDFPWSDPVS
jgi:hypothetical protein